LRKVCRFVNIDFFLYFLPFLENNTEWKGDFTFVQGADSQFGLIEFFKNNWTYNPNNTWTEDLNLLSLAVQQWNTLQPEPKFVTICGDLVNDFPGEQNRGKQLDDFRKTIDKLRQDIPLVLLGGNHDFLNTPTNESVQQYTSEFGDDYYSFWVGGVMFVVLNVQYYKNHTAVENLYRAQDEWLDVQLQDAARNKYRHVIVLQHIPWFLKNIEEEDDPMVSL